MKGFSSTWRKNTRRRLYLLPLYLIFSCSLAFWKVGVFISRYIYPCEHIHGSTWVICRRELMFTLKSKRHLNCLYTILFPCASALICPIKLTSLCHILVSQMMKCTSLWLTTVNTSKTFCWCQRVATGGEGRGSFHLTIFLGSEYMPKAQMLAFLRYIYSWKVVWAHRRCMFPQTEHQNITGAVKCNGSHLFICVTRLSLCGEEYYVKVRLWCLPAMYSRPSLNDNKLSSSRAHCSGFTVSCWIKAPLLTSLCLASIFQP